MPETLQRSLPQPTALHAGLTSKPANSIARYGLSYALIACLGFAFLDTLNRTRPENRLASAEKSAIWWATKQFQATQKSPDLVLLGSSLMFAAQNDCDATFFSKSFDAITHYRCDFLESKLSQVTGKSIKTASFVIGGQMATDAYAITSTLLSKEKAPAAIIWGIAPRDFLDATFDHPEETETVRLMTDCQ